MTEGPRKSRKAIKGSDTPDDNCCVANVPPRGCHEFGKIIGESRRRTISRCIVDTEGDDDQVGGLRRDARQELPSGITDRCPRKSLRAPCDRTTG